MADARDVLADHVREAFLVVGLGLVLFGAVGPGPVGGVAVAGVVTLIAGLLLSAPVAARLRTEGEESAGDRLAALRERYARGELDRDEFERRVGRQLAEEDPEAVPDGQDAGALREPSGSMDETR